MKKMSILLAIAVLAGCANVPADSWYGKKLAEQDRMNSTLNAPTPDKAEFDRAQVRAIR